ncbi:hypothetical protein JCM16303_000959 [Sporobolomyces ruberrimus]
MSAPSSLPPPSSSHQSDVRKRTVLPNTLQNLRTTNSASSQSAQLDQLDSDAYLDKLEEELNRKVDGEVEGLVEGLKELIALARIDPLTSHPSQAHLRSLQSQLRTQQMLRNAHSLLSMSHQLKLLHLFGDQETVQTKREELDQELNRDIEGPNTTTINFGGGGGGSNSNPYAYQGGGGGGGGDYSSSIYNNPRTNHALKEHDFFQSTSSTLDAYLAQGQAVLGNLTTQREVMKGTKKRLLNAANTLGLSRETIQFIERRTKADWWILVGGGTFTLVCFGMILKYFG